MFKRHLYDVALRCHPADELCSNKKNVAVRTHNTKSGAVRWTAKRQPPNNRRLVGVPHLQIARDS